MDNGKENRNDCLGFRGRFLGCHLRKPYVCETLSSKVYVILSTRPLEGPLMFVLPYLFLVLDEYTIYC